MEDLGFLGVCVFCQLCREQCVLSCTFGGKPKFIKLSKIASHKKTENHSAVGVVVHTHIPALGRWVQEGQELEIILGCKGNSGPAWAT